MIYLLDVNVLIALADPAHVQHEAAHGWFGSGGSASFATCPLTENGCCASSATPDTRIRRERQPLRPASWPHCGPCPGITSGRTTSARWIPAASTRLGCLPTDSYLLALAVAHGEQLATLDRRLVPDAVVHGAAALRVI